MPADRLPSSVRILLAMALTSCVGSGLTLPFLLVYLHDVRHLTLAETGLLIALPAVVGLALTPTTGSLIDAIGPRAVGVSAMLTSALGSALLPTVRTVGEAAAPLVLIGLGEAGIATAINTLFAQLLSDERSQIRAFSIQFALVNVGLGVGAFIAGVVVNVQRPSTFTLIYLLDALSFFLSAIAGLFLRVPPRVPRAETHQGEQGRWAGCRKYREVVRNGIFLRYAFLLGAIYLVGYAALDAGFVGVSTEVVRVSPRLVADMFAVNTLVIVCFQQLTTRWVIRIARTSALALTLAFFAAAWLVEWIATFFPHEVAGDVLVVCFGVVFAVGEMTLSPVRNVVVNALASDELRGRYNAASWSTIQTSNVVAPALIGVMLGDGLGRQLVLGLVVLSVLVGGGALRFRRYLSPAQDNRAAELAAPEQTAY